MGFKKYGKGGKIKEVVEIKKKEGSKEVEIATVKRFCIKCGADITDLPKDQDICESCKKKIEKEETTKECATEN